MIINPYNFGVAPGATVTLDPAKKGASGALSGGDLILTVDASGTPSTCLATTGYTTGKRYFEVRVDAFGNVPRVGVAKATSSTSFGVGLGGEAGQWGYEGYGDLYTNGAGTTYFGPTFANGDILGISIDFGTRRLWVAINNTQVQGSPAAGTSPLVTYSSGLGTMYGAVSGNNSSIVTARFKAADFTYSPPAGFSAYE